MNAALQPLWPVAEIADDGCYDHNVATLPCPQCQADSEWYRQSREAERLERQADETEALVLTDQSDRECLREFAEHLRRRASQIRGRLGAIADREANEERDAQKPWTMWQGGQPK